MVSRRRLLKGATALTALSAMPLWLRKALAGTELVGLSLPLQPIPCTGQSNIPGGNQLLRPENFCDWLLPDPLPIRRVIGWFDGSWQWANPPTPNQYGNITFAIDPQMTYCRSAGYPVQQKFWPYYLKNLLVHEIAQGQPRKAIGQFNSAPMNYRSGDAIIVAPEMFGNGPPISGYFLVLGFESVNGDIGSPGWILPQQAMNVPLDSASSGPGGYCIRNISQPSPIAFTQVRARITSLVSQTGGPTTISGISFGIQASAGSPTMSGAPSVGTICGLQPQSFGQGFQNIAMESVWSDWTPVVGLAGQSILTEIDMFGPANNWSSTHIAGLGAWWSQTNSVNSTTMLGTVSYQANTTHVIDRVQVQ